jgi:hypothetical protein
MRGAILELPTGVNRIETAGRMRTRQSQQAAWPAHPIAAPCGDATASGRHDVTEHAILIAPTEHGWRWQVIDQNGVSVARGLSADQSDAMDCAHRAIEVCG